MLFLAGKSAYNEYSIVE